MILFVVAAVILAVFVIGLTMSPSKKQNNSKMYYAASRTPNDYGQLYGAPAQGAPQGAPMTPPPMQQAPQGAPQGAPMPPPPMQQAPQGTPQGAPMAPPPVQQAPQGAPQGAPMAPPPKPPVPKKPFSPIPLLLIAGIVFLFLGGIIFLTNTWDTLPDIARALSLLSASVIAFGFNVLAERVLKLPKTGLAFYILGCIFLPLALGGIGAFSLLGEWFSFEGKGCCLLIALICLCVSITGFLGQSNYKSPFLAWLSLAGIGSASSVLAYSPIPLLTFDHLYPEKTVSIFVAVALAVISVIFTVIAEISLRRHPVGTTPLSKAWMPFLYALHIWNYGLVVSLTRDALVVSTICLLVISLLCLNERFIVSKLNLGVFGFVPGLLIALGIAMDLGAADTINELFVKLNFICIAIIFLLLTPASLPQLKSATRIPLLISGLLLCITVIPSAFIHMFISMEERGMFFLFLFAPLVIASLHFAAAPKNRLPKDLLSFLPYTLLLYSVAMQSAQDADNFLYRLLLIAATILLLVQFFFTRRFWSLMLSICSCAAVALLWLPNAQTWLSWLCTIALLVSLVYAISAKRPLLELSSAWILVPNLLISCYLTFRLLLPETQSWFLTFAVLALVYLAEYTILRTQLHSTALRSFCLSVSVFQYFVATFSIHGTLVRELPNMMGWFVLYILALLVMTAGSLHRNKNGIALPMTLYLFFTLNNFVSIIDKAWQLSGDRALALQIISYVLIIILLAGMGRILVPDGFCNTKDGMFRVDWGLLVAALPILFVSYVIDWYPSILCCLLLAIYSMLYIGRVKNRFIPILLASAFTCLTLFFHNIHDPFGMLEWWHHADFKAPQILLYVLPMHLFILSLLKVLPKKFAPAVHIARFAMYCFTMFCLLIASLNFGKAMDGIILAAFSFLILLGSFAVKRLRWFTLGFSVLTLMTVKLTWEFWQSLHWGIYLFLAGAALIGIAFYFEYKVRKNNEKAALPQEEQPEGTPSADTPKEKLRLFKEWSW